MELRPFDIIGIFTLLERYLEIFWARALMFRILIGMRFILPT